MFTHGQKVRCVLNTGWSKWLVVGAVYTARDTTDFAATYDIPGWGVVRLNNHLFEPVQEKPMQLSTDPVARKGTPITSGVLDYFPLAIAEVAICSKVGNDQHNPGQPLHWAKDKSTDHADCIARHLIDRGTFDTDGIRHSAKLAWRALAQLQIELEQAAKDTQ